MQRPGAFTATVCLHKLSLVCLFVCLSVAARGSTAVGVLAIYYTAPLTSLAKVVAERDSSSLHWPLCAMNIVNGLLWFAYGLVG